MYNQFWAVCIKHTHKIMVSSLNIVCLIFVYGLDLMCCFGSISAVLFVENVCKELGLVDSKGTMMSSNIKLRYHKSFSKCRRHMVTVFFVSCRRPGLYFFS